METRRNNKTRSLCLDAIAAVLLGVCSLRVLAGTNSLREVVVVGPLIFDGQTGTAVVNLDAEGDENAVGFSLKFDPTAVTYLGASPGSDATNATMDINANQATNGQVGIILALPTDTSFSPGLRQLVQVNFQAVTAASEDSPVALTDLPVKREVADTNALPVVSTYLNGTIEVNPRPAVAINASSPTNSSQSIILSWPLWATNYTLQQAVGTLPNFTWTNVTVSPVINNNAETITVSVSGAVQFFRLRHN